MSIGPLIGVQPIMRNMNMNNTGNITGYSITFLEWAVTPNGWDFDERQEYFDLISEVDTRMLQLFQNKRKYTDIKINCICKP